MKTSVERVRAAFEHHDQRPLVRTELWIGRKPFEELRIKDNLAGQIRLRERFGMDMLFLSLEDPELPSSALDYRRFSVDEVEKAIRTSDLFVGIILDGPFQRLVEKKGLLPLLSELHDDPRASAAKFKEEGAAMNLIIRQSLALNVGAVIIADDLAHQNATYMNPTYLEELLGPLYCDSVSTIHSAGVYALFHSCGNITALLPRLVDCGFDGLAACQNQCLDLASLKREYGPELTFLAGMDADLLEAESLTASRKNEFGRRIRSLAQGGGFILCSSCGMSSQNSVKRLQALYEVAEASLEINQCRGKG